MDPSDQGTRLGPQDYPCPCGDGGVVGSGVGIAVGTEVGSGDGGAVGSGVGTAVGTEVGSGDGGAVGSGVGWTLGVKLPPQS